MEFGHYKCFIIIFIIPSHHPLFALYIRSHYPPLLACLRFSRFSLVPYSPLKILWLLKKCLEKVCVENSAAWAVYYQEPLMALNII